MIQQIHPTGNRQNLTRRKMERTSCAGKIGGFHQVSFEKPFHIGGKLGATRYLWYY